MYAQENGWRDDRDIWWQLLSADIGVHLYQNTFERNAGEARRQMRKLGAPQSLA